MSVWTFMLYLHSGIRWLVVLALVIAAGWLLVRLALNRPFNELTRRIVSYFGIVVAGQWLIGLSLLVLTYFERDGFAGYHGLHTLLMTGAVVTAQLPARFKKSPDRIRYLATLGLIAATFVLIYVGIIVLPQGWGSGA